MRGFVAALLLGGLAAVPGYPVTLKEMFDQAGPALGYDKYVELDTGVTYTGGLWIGATFNRITAKFEGTPLAVRIVGHGAILDLQTEEICAAYSTSRLDLEDCIVLNGAVRYRGYKDSEVALLPSGSVRYVTFYKPMDYGVRLFACGQNILIERNIVVDPVDTGNDFMYLTGFLHPWLPTGSSVALSLAGSFAIYDNWSYLSDGALDPLRHFVILCDYG
jgi:hypothetical protein